MTSLKDKFERWLASEYRLARLRDAAFGFTNLHATAVARIENAKLEMKAAEAALVEAIEATGGSAEVSGYSLRVGWATFGGDRRKAKWVIVSRPAHERRPLPQFGRRA